jgi:hypothetical protein
MSDRPSARGHDLGTVLAGAWGLAEGTVFFVVPDVPIGWIALRRPRSLVAAWLAATGSGVLGAALVHWAVRHGWDPDPLFGRLPGSRPGDLGRVRTAVASDVTRAFVMGSVSGIPLKVYVAEAARQGVPVSRVLALAAINRAPRLGLYGLALGIVGAVARDRWQPGRLFTALAYGLGWTVFYAWFWTRPRADDASAASAAIA